MDRIFELIKQEEKRQKEGIQLIPSENFASAAVREALGSVLTNKYSEGYPGKRYYQGNKIIDEIENLVIERGKELFGVPHMNVQPYSGSPANAAVLMALVEPGELICGMILPAGGHLTHGHPRITFSGKYYRSVQYDVEEDGRINYDKVHQLVDQSRPKLVWVGPTAYPFILDWEKFAHIADSVGAWLAADIAHIAGLVVGGVHPSPVPFVDVVTSTTHKTLRGPRGAFIAVTEKGLAASAERFGEPMKICKKIDRAVFPGMQGGPHDNAIAAIGVAFEEASRPEFKEYAEQIVKNAKALANSLRNGGVAVGGDAYMRPVLRVFGTENHLMLVDVGLAKGKEVAERLEEAGIIVNANTIPHDQARPFRPSGIRIGTPAMTTRGFKEKEFEKVGEWVGRVINGENADLRSVRDEIAEFMRNW